MEGIFRHPEDKDTKLLTMAKPAKPNSHDNASETAEAGQARLNRYDRAHANDLENMVPFFVGSTVWLLAIQLQFAADVAVGNQSEPVDWMAFIVLHALFATFRLLHSIALINSLQPWRSIFYVICVPIIWLVNAWAVVRMFKVF